MQSTHCPNEIFAKILSEFRKKASHMDMKNLKRAIEHPKLSHLEVTFNHFTSRSKQFMTEKGNFICPICLFAQKEIYDDSVWEELCQKLFGCHFIQYGGSETVKTRLKPVRLATKRKSSGGTNRYLLQYLFSHELLLKRCNRKGFERDNPLTVSYIRKIHFSKGDTRILDKLSKQSFGKLKIYTDVSAFIEHLNTCQSHYKTPMIKIVCNENEQYSELNYDVLYKSKLDGFLLGDLPMPRDLIKEMVKDSKSLFEKISLKSPAPKLFDNGSQNHDFLEHIIWPMVTLAISLQLEDHINLPTSQFDSYSEENCRFLALRDLLRCICDVAEDLEYDFEINQWMKAKFAAFHGILEILDSFFCQY